jgi:hypothetical protein
LVATLVIKTKELEIAGIIEMNGVNRINNEVKSKAFTGTPAFENLVNGLSILSLLSFDKE